MTLVATLDTIVTILSNAIVDKKLSLLPTQRFAVHGIIILSIII